MPVLVQWIFKVAPKMADVVMLFDIFFLVSGIVGIELFKADLLKPHL